MCTSNNDFNNTLNNDLFFGKVFFHLNNVDSTNNVLNSIIKEKKVPEGTVVLADHQTAGKGQRGNTWLDEPGTSMIQSLYLQPSFLSLQQQFYLNIVVSLGVAECLEAVNQLIVKIKWPNDIYVGNEKIGGILIETSSSGTHLQEAVVGIGLNVNQSEFPPELPNPSSIYLKTEKKQNVLALTKKSWPFLEHRYEELRNGQLEGLKAAYLQRLFRYQEWHSFVVKGGVVEGRIVGVEEWGRLLLETKEGVERFDLKEVRFLV